MWEVAKDQRGAGGRGQDVPSQGTLQVGTHLHPVGHLVGSLLVPPLDPGTVLVVLRSYNGDHSLYWGPLTVLVCSGTGGMWPSLSLLWPGRVTCGGGHQSPD